MMCPSHDCCFMRDCFKSKADLPLDTEVVMHQDSLCSCFSPSSQESGISKVKGHISTVFHKAAQMIQFM